MSDDTKAGGSTPDSDSEFEPEGEAFEVLGEDIARLNENVERQMSPQRILMTGMIYGVGFVIGSTVIAAIIIGFFAPYVEHVPFVKGLIEAGHRATGR